MMRPLPARACLLFLAWALSVSAIAGEPLTLITVANSWKYNYSGVDLTGQFYRTNYDDSAWASGPGLLGYDSSNPWPYPDPLRTQYPFNAGYRSIYFRTHFAFPSNTLGVVLRATNYVDDGAVIYLNGREVHRLRMPLGPVGFNTLASSISNPEGQGNVLQLPAADLRQGDNVLAVEVHQYQASDSDVIFGMALIAFLPEPGPVRITNQPPNRTIEEGDPTTFAAEVTGSPPYFFQWFKDGSPLPNATNALLTLYFASLADAGDYSFVVSNKFSSATSSNATLTVQPGPPLLITMTNAWRYRADGVDLGEAWRSASFPESNWPQGNALFYNTPEPLPAPRGTQVPLTNATGQSITTWYFRTRFDWSGPTSGVNLRARTLVDDGAIFYLNGLEAGRLGMPGVPTPIAYDTRATYRVETLTNYTTVELASASLVEGENVLAVEVHQSSRETSDMVFGLSLGTNFALSLPDLTFWGPASANTEAGPVFLTECELLETCAWPTTRRVLRFDTQTRNMGQADVILGDPINNPLFEYDPCHGHYHFDHFAEYRLLDTNGARVATGHKVGFCLLDFQAWDPNASPEYVYDCDYQGIQRGWSDIYMAALPCQWIDITGLPGGTYILELEVDPENRIPESDESNNISRVLVSFPDCPPPPNDEFENALMITAAIDSIPFNSRCATRQFGEPLHVNDESMASLWYQWTAPSAGSLTIDTHGSGFDTLLAVYRGAELTNLTVVASNDDADWHVTSRVTFDVTPGMHYWIAVDAYEGEGGDGVLNLRFKPSIRPAFTDIEYVPTNRVRISLTGGAADAYAIETSETNGTWVEWLRVTNRTGNVELVDPAATSMQKLYRARLLP